MLGDDGKLYVPAENVDIYREQVVPLATMITPNHFEAETLSGLTIETEVDAIRACSVLHARYEVGDKTSSPPPDMRASAIHFYGRRAVQPCWTAAI